MSWQLSTPFLAAVIGHSEVTDFAAENINLRREDVEDYREQVRRLREKLDKYAADHPDHGLIKTLLSGSLAKGTALKTLNDIDVAFYVKVDKAPSKERGPAGVAGSAPARSLPADEARSD